MKSITDIKNKYQSLKLQIEKRLNEFSKNRNASNEILFSEMCFCLCTPQSKALYAWQAICDLRESGLLFEGSVSEIEALLKRVRFAPTKAKRIVRAREEFFENGFPLRNLIEGEIFSVRENLVKEVCGFGFKEASHFLRNIGMGDEIAIIDRHVLRNMKPFVNLDNEKITGKKNYERVENIIREFAKEIKIKLSHLDFVLLYDENNPSFNSIEEFR